MKAYSNIMPNACRVIQLDNGMAEILFTENITESGGNYEYDQYRITVPYRDTLDADVEANCSAWLQYAKNLEYESKSKEVRAERTRLLTECDWTQCVDSPITAEMKAEWAAYRQALRDVPEQDGFPYNVGWPQKPDGK